ncbi:TPA: hypothetical protein HA338_13205 [Methanosarcina acetivorans]|uniref:Glycosyltransferase RgtA/B/C/D-like domain-containing protein n=2 Tax=Methanosarcina acetivorans TaxID=2214 RepID=Q8TRJ4_METAC|nr:hypothetical protein [Methanosarcina acetivorans]AAM04602.1 predicted protein [Methanosarcina acetivorans C2A]HIH94927.1 hypothetical protein [Methanosarcina acetivorans]
MVFSIPDREKLKKHIHVPIWYFQRNKLNENIKILTLYTLFTFILTYPVIFKIRTHIPGMTDAFQWIRSLWYTPTALFNPDLTKLTHDYLIFYPYGVPVTPLHSAFNQVVSYVLSRVMEIHIAYNILFLFSFIFGAYGTYLLITYLSGDKLASFIAGLVFAFSPYHFAHSLGHLGAVSIEWLPFCALYLMKMFREGGVRNSFFAGVFFIFVAMSDLQYMVFMGIFVMLLFLYEIYIFLREEKKDYREIFEKIFYKYALFGVVSFSGLIPLTIDNLLIAISNENFLKLNPFEAVTFSTDLLSFFLPSVFHPVFGDFTKDIYSNFSGNVSENTTYIGYTVILLSSFATIRLKGDKCVKFWSIAALFFSLISLGPLLHINGNTTFTVFNTTVPLPHLVLYYLIPFLDNCRTVGRFFVIASLSFAVLTGYGISELLKSNKNNKKIIAIIISSLIIFEYLAIPFPVSAVSRPSFYEEISQDKDNYALLEIPATLNYNAGVSIIYYQTIHGKPVVGNWAARLPSNARNFELNTPVVRELTYLQPFTVDILNQDINRVGTSILNNYNISYIILHTDYMDNKEVNLAKRLIQESLHTEQKTYEKDSLIVYRVKKEPVKPFMILKDNWYALEEWDGVPTRWMSNNATLIICSNEKINKTLSFRILSHHSPKNIEIYAGDDCFEETIPTDFTYMKIPLTLEKGENIIEFSTWEKSISPAQISDSPDTRELSFAMQNITVS